MFDLEFRVSLKGQDIGQVLSARPTHSDREIAHDKCGRYLLGRYRDRPFLGKRKVRLLAFLFPLLTLTGGASGTVVGLREN